MKSFTRSLPILVLIVFVAWFAAKKTRGTVEMGQTEFSNYNDPNIEKQAASRDTAVARASATPASRTTASDEHTSGHAPASATSAEQALQHLQAQSKAPWNVRLSGPNDKIKTLSAGTYSGEKPEGFEGSTDAGLAQAFVNEYSESLFGVEPADLQKTKEEVTDRTKIVYTQVVDGTPVFGGTLTTFIENGELNRVQNDLSALSPSLPSAPSFSVNQAIADLNAKGILSLKLVGTSPVKTVLYPSATALVYALDFIATNSSKNETLRVIYDIENRALIKTSPAHLH